MCSNRSSNSIMMRKSKTSPLNHSGSRFDISELFQLCRKYRKLILHLAFSLINKEQVPGMEEILRVCMIVSKSSGEERLAHGCFLVNGACR